MKYVEPLSIPSAILLNVKPSDYRYKYQCTKFYMQNICPNQKKKIKKKTINKSMKKI